jgi:hypothetical protein
LIRFRVVTIFLRWATTKRCSSVNAAARIECGRARMSSLTVKSLLNASVCQNHGFVSACPCHRWFAPPHDSAIAQQLTDAQIARKLVSLGRCAACGMGQERSLFCVRSNPSPFGPTSFTAPLWPPLRPRLRTSSATGSGSVEQHAATQPPSTRPAFFDKKLRLAKENLSLLVCQGSVGDS